MTLQGDITDVRMKVLTQVFDLEWRKRALKAWFDKHMQCPKNHSNGHKWVSHGYVDEVRAWIWKCDVCKCIRISTTLCNDIIITSRYTFKALIVTDDFAEPQKIIRKALKLAKMRLPQ